MQFNYDNALGRYIETEFADTFIDPATHKIETNSQWGGLISYQHFWLDNLRSTLVYSYAERDNDMNYVADTVRVNTSPFMPISSVPVFLYSRREENLFFKLNQHVEHVGRCLL